MSKIITTVQHGDLLAQILEHSNGCYELKWDDQGLGWVDDPEFFAQLEEAVLRLAVLIRCDRVGGGLFTLDTNDFCKAADQFLISNVN
jgi:hypothetical protein